MHRIGGLVLSFLSVVPLGCFLTSASACNDQTSTGTDGASDDATTDADADVSPPPMEASCIPQPIDANDSRLNWIPPETPQPTACSDVQLAGYWATCKGPQSSGANCLTWIGANPTCDACLEPTGPTSGIFLRQTWLPGLSNTWDNAGGCVAVLMSDVSSTGCGAAINQLILCTVASCMPTCPYVTSVFAPCMGEAENSTCLSIYNHAQSICGFAGDNAFSTCSQPNGPSSTTKDQVMELARLLCGGYATDGGVDGSVDATAD
jgi:hypothetical protein